MITGFFYTVVRPTKHRFIFMDERYFRALELRNAGKTFSEIGTVLDVSSGRARQIVAIAERRVRLNQQGPNWVQGLPTKLANALIAEGFTNKEEVHQALLDNRIGLYPDSVKGTVPGIGPKSIRLLNEWVG